MENLPGISLAVSIEKTSDKKDIAWCAKLMADNEPWITLQRSYEDSIRLLSDPISEIYLLQHNSQPVGFVVIKMKGSFTGYIQILGLTEGIRGQGVGEATIRYIEELIFRSGPNVFICASSFNLRAQKLYHRLGYETVGILKDYIIKGHDEVLMRKTRGPGNDFRQKPANP